jgi:hypothetical protein
MLATIYPIWTTLSTWRSINSSPLNPTEDLMDNQSRQSPGSTPLNANFKLQNCPNTRSSTPCGAHRFLAPTWLVGKPTRTGGALSAEERKRRGSTAQTGHRTDVRRSTSRRHDEAVTAKMAPFVEHHYVVTGNGASCAQRTSGNTHRDCSHPPGLPSLPARHHRPSSRNTPTSSTATTPGQPPSATATSRASPAKPRSQHAAAEQPGEALRRPVSTRPRDERQR